MARKLAFCIYFSIMLFSSDVMAEGIAIGTQAESSYLTMTGLWDFHTSDYTVTGTCPAGNPASGTLSIFSDTNATKTAVLQFLNGITCNPSESCMYRGTSQDPISIVVSNSIIDQNGGYATNTLAITWSSNSTAYGTGASVYNFSNGVSCTWNYKISLTRRRGSAKNGWWYDSKAIGTGLSIEIQNDKLFLAWYSYDEKGNPVWLTSYGNLTDTGDFNGTLYEWKGWNLLGQYFAPTASEAGTILLDFTSDNTTTMSWSYKGIDGNCSLVKFMDTLSPGVRDPRNLNGWWFDPDYDGMGLYMESEGEKMFMAWYNYDPFGKPRWWTASETFRTTDDSFYSKLTEWRDGQCFGCSYKLPVAVEVGDLLVQFTSDTTATMFWNGKIFHIRRFIF